MWPGRASHSSRAGEICAHFAPRAGVARSSGVLVARRGTACRPVPTVVARSFGRTTSRVAATRRSCARRGRLPATSPIAAEHLAHGRIDVARPDYHLMVDDGSVRSVRGPRVNGLRPAIDVLFRSAAHTCGGRVIAVVLTGMLDDGVGGLREVRSKGGIAVVQDPEDATHAPEERDRGRRGGPRRSHRRDGIAAGEARGSFSVGRWTNASSERRPRGPG